MLRLALLLRYAPSMANACAVCFGGNDNKSVIRAFYWGGGVLLFCTFGLLGSMIYGIARMEKTRLAQDRARGLLDEPS